MFLLKSLDIQNLLVETLVSIIVFHYISVFVLVEEDDGEVFKVKKSKQSSRLAKRREKERRRPDGDNNKYDHTHDEV